MADRLQAADVHAMVGSNWRACLADLGVPDEALQNRHQPCPMCGGKDRFRWDNRHDRGGYFCGGCGAGDGFKLLMGLHGWTFGQALREVAAWAGGGVVTASPVVTRRPPPAPKVASLTARSRDLLRTACVPELVPDAVEYLARRKLWPLPAGCNWQAHCAVDYYRSLGGKAREHLGRFPALVARVQDVAGETVTAHVTWLEHGWKLDRGEGVPARKMLSPVEGRTGCAVRLMPLVGDVLGVAEGIETALAASALHGGMPVWAALNTSLLKRFVTPPGVRKLFVFADRDVAGLEAAMDLREEMDGRCLVEVVRPTKADFADEIAA